MTLFFFEADDTDEDAEKAQAMIRREKKVKRIASKQPTAWCGALNRFNCATLESLHNFDNILNKSGQLIVFPMKMGYITRKPRMMKLQIIMFGIFGHQLGVLVPKMNSTSIKEKFIARRATGINQGHFYDRSLIRRWPIFYAPMADRGILPHDSLLAYIDTLSYRRNRCQTWSELTHIAASNKKYTTSEWKQQGIPPERKQLYNFLIWPSGHGPHKVKKNY